MQERTFKRQARKGLILDSKQRRSQPRLRRQGRLSQGLLLLVALLCCACASQNKKTGKDYMRQLPPGESALRKITDPAKLPNYRAMWEQREGVDAAIGHSLDFFAKPSSHNHYPFEGFSHDRIVASLKACQSLLSRAKSAEQFSGYMKLYFDAYESRGCDDEGTVLFTAYYQPVFDGSLTPTAEFSQPLYRLPPDLVKDEDGTPRGRRDGDRIVPYYTRHDIDVEQVLAGQELEMVYLRDPLETFIIHVQGSAKINLPDGEELFVGYAGKTDRAYTSIGRALVDDGKIDGESLSLSAIKNHFQAHPDEVRGYLDRNESYVFFTESGPGGPFGSIGSPVTDYRTIATDKSLYPRGALAAIETTVPQIDRNAQTTPRPFKSLVLDQDTGGAIRTPGRCDLYIGTGDEAEWIAGHTKYEGRLIYLFLREGLENPPWSQE